MQKYTKPDGDKFWACVLIYVDNGLLVSNEPKQVIKTYVKVSLWNIHSSEISHYHIPGSDDNDKHVRAMICGDYVKTNLKKDKTELAEIQFFQRILANLSYINVNCTRPFTAVSTTTD